MHRCSESIGAIAAALAKAQAELTNPEKSLTGIIPASSSQGQDRRWARAWSPEQIARRLPIDFPDDKTMRISHEAIYQALFIQGRSELRRELARSRAS